MSSLAGDEELVEVGTELDPSAPTEDQGKPRSLSRDAWETLRSNPVFWIAAVIIVLLVSMAIAPQLWAHQDPYATDFANLSRSRGEPGAGAIFGYDNTGRDIYTLTIYGARASIVVGVIATLGTALIGIILGVFAGMGKGWLDALIGRLTDIVFGLPLLVGSIVLLSSFPTSATASAFDSISKVTLALVVFGWPTTTRLMRSSVIQVKQADFVEASRALGASTWEIVRRHILPNALGPVVVVSTIALGAYIGAEATLSYLGIGLQPPAISWGIAINDAQGYVRTSPHMLLFPVSFLAITVLAFIMLGDAVREAFDPKLR